MRIRVNGSDTELETGTTLAELLRRFDVEADAAGFAVAINETVVPRREWVSRRIENGDTVEIIRAVQGG